MEAVSSQVSEFFWCRLVCGTAAAGGTYCAVSARQERDSSADRWPVHSPSPARLLAWGAAAGTRAAARDPLDSVTEVVYC